MTDKRKPKGGPKRSPSGKGHIGKPRTPPRLNPSNPTCPITKAITHWVRTKTTDSLLWSKWLTIVLPRSQTPRSQPKTIMPGTESSERLAGIVGQTQRPRNKGHSGPLPTVPIHQDHRLCAPAVISVAARDRLQKQVTTNQNLPSRLRPLWMGRTCPLY
jgi:hypothetical protein